MKDKLNEMIRNLRETTRQNIEQDWLKTNRERFTRMLQGQRDLATVVEHDPLRAGAAGVGPARRLLLDRSAGDGGEPVLRAAGRLRLRGAQAPLDRVPARRGPGRPVRQGEEADPAHRGPGRLRADQLGPRRGDAAQHHRAAGPVRGIGARRRRARVVLRRSARPTRRSSTSSPRASAWCSTRSRPTPSPRTCSSSPSRRPRSCSRSRRSCASRTRTSAGRRSCSPSRTSRRRRKNQEVEQSKRLVEEKAGQLAVSSKYKSEFIANMSHELRTPLNSLLILAEQLEDNPDQHHDRHPGRVRERDPRSGTDLLELLNSILDLAKVESGTVTVEISSCRSSSSAQRPVPRVRARRRSDRESRLLDRRRTRHVPTDIVTDPQRLRQILKNLLANAFKFTERGEVDVAIGLARQRLEPESQLRSDDAASVIAFAVTRHRDRDRRRAAAAHLRGVRAGRRHHRPAVRRHRPGPVDQPRAGRPARRRDHPRQHAGEGSTFTVYLPSSTRGDHSAVAAPKSPTARAIGGAGIVAPGALMLGIDERRAARHPNRRARRSWSSTTTSATSSRSPRCWNAGDAEVVSAESGEDAHRDARASTRHRPRADGHHDAGAWTATPRSARSASCPWTADLPIIAVTGKVVDGERERCLDAGANDYIPKPVESGADVPPDARPVVDGREVAGSGVPR